MRIAARVRHDAAAAAGRGRRLAIAGLVSSLLASAALLAGGCGLVYRLRPPAYTRECDGVVVPTEAMDGDFVWVDRVRIKTTGSGESFDAGYELVTEKRGDELTLVGMSPFGAKLFAVRQNGTRVDVERFAGPRLATAPRNILWDLHRARLLGIEGAPLADGEHAARVRGLEVVESWRDGRLERRRLRAADSGEEHEVVVDYRWSADARGGPALEGLRLRNPGCGYEMRLVPARPR